MPDINDDADAADVLTTLLGCPPEMLDVSLDQLRTLAVVRTTGTAQRAARVLGREQSSVQKQLDSLNKTATRLVGEALVVKQGRSKDFLFTPSGEEVVALAKQTLLAVTDSLHSSRRRLGSTVTFGTTEFTVQFLGVVWHAMREDFERRDVHLKIEHVRTRDLWRKLDGKKVDLVCGSFAAEPGRPPTLDYDFLEWHREGVALLTNLSARELPDNPVTANRLPGLPLLAPTSGLLAQFLSRWYGPDYRGVLDVIADIDSLNYGLNLLTSDLLHGCLLTTERVAAAALDGSLPGQGLRKIKLADDYTPRLEIVTGIFARKGERERYAYDHPLNLLWNAFAEATPTRVIPPALPG
ncbi:MULTISPECIES: LysR family transcriptional regulator [Actinoalloteichus]|uniref:Transcriptional regulator n=1 Tax=Actinoalloteichus fjordicus TaxID=1612552 RepID=A0AAC9LFA0_9PSEU|nr:MULTISPECIES: LysR family transcriptional regulator [Actinoalloteichus]APU16621.1 transcriptional regulator [Actinoalloteichus fjordicus]APU22687.1 transcriptional regulator [Actinoalloteichus sp. GBA129-24]